MSFGIVIILNLVIVRFGHLLASIVSFIKDRRAARQKKCSDKG